MEHTYAPWRSAYFGSKSEQCIFCLLSSGISLETHAKSNNLAEFDTENRIFYRDSHIFCVMNKFPYTPGHFLIIPHIHTHSPELLDAEVWLHLQRYAQKGVALLKEFGAQGINMGINIEKAGGAGIPEHIHMHLVPRYIGDTNFFTTIGDTRAYGVDFDAIFKRIAELSQKHYKP